MPTINPISRPEDNRQSLNERFEAMLQTIANERARRGKLKAPDAVLGHRGAGRSHPPCGGAH